MTPDNTTPSTGWTYKHSNTHGKGGCDLYKDGKNICTVFPNVSAHLLCELLNRLLSLDTASEVDVSDEATQAMSKEEYDSPITIPGSYTHVAINAHSKGFKQCRDLLLPQLAKAKAEAAASQAEVEKLREENARLKNKSVDNSCSCKHPRISNNGRGGWYCMDCSQTINNP